MTMIREGPYVFVYPDGFAVDVRTAPVVFLDGEQPGHPVAVPPHPHPHPGGQSFRDDLYRALRDAVDANDADALEALRRRTEWCARIIEGRTRDAVQRTR